MAAAARRARVPRPLDKTIEAEAGLGYHPARANLINRVFVTSFVTDNTGIPWGPGTTETYQALEPHLYENGLSADRAIARAWQLTSAPTSIRAVVTAEAPDASLQAAIAAHGEGIIALA